ncbi:hypothetical protein [Streptomyces sp. NPDC059916]|uniref:hypothetical protein n=1 Tax=Streptomyces sp. NPDC059916 TaxID=3347001 RepID=UPI0036C9B864
MRTQLGGVFFLIVVVQALDLYPDFSAPERPGLPLDLWDCVELLGTALLAPMAQAERTDPVWSLLGGLAARPHGESPGTGFRPPPWRVPADWLAPFGTSESAARQWSWSVTRGRLRVDHPAGFPAVLVPRHGPAAGQVRTEAHRMGALPGSLRRGRLPALPTGALSAWVQALARYAGARCGLALGCPQREVAALLLRRPARVCATPTRLDVFFSLADHPVAVRRAGLDRDPGWIPAGGRSVSFHFD